MAKLIPLQEPLPVGSYGKRSNGWWGLLTLIVTEGSLFGYLLFSYFYLAAQTQQQWPPDGLPRLAIPGINTLILLASSGFVWISEYCLKSKKIRSSIILMAVAILLGTGFIMIQLSEWNKKPYTMITDLYGSLYFTITGFHMAHVVVGIIILSLLLLWMMLGYFDDKRHVSVSIGGLYWHFVDGVWLFVFATLYLSPYL
ncbi:Cytochrome c oxidase subunit III [Candidatus Methylobacter favarea]|uniref:Cytochrome c oxidase subunit III n=1 Tax=Candidatus Methylobacter favarea TaxID=2707345 RepID=A0A8S0Y6U2_9GAMM|nr:cytochrome c oxidase subunit 3 [Candidatus Methylobacter favarea]CAA9892199.1 Cytochrome c oxidase subunit III [Candidatus Methylobacter favarea]